MVDTFRLKIARLIAPRHYDDVDNRVNVRVAKIISSMDPFEPIYRKFQGIFSDDFEKPEEKLDERGQLLMKMLGFQLYHDVSFKYLMDWIVNSQVNAMLKAPARTNEERGEVLMWGKAQVAGIVVLKTQLKRLNSLYDEMLAEGKETPPDPGVSIE